MEDGIGGMSPSEEDEIRDFLKLLQELCRAGVALDNTETSFSAAASNSSTSTASTRDDQGSGRSKGDVEENEDEEKMAVVYIVLVLVFFSTSLIILLVRHVRREKETRRVERFYTDYLETPYTTPRPVVYFDKRGRPLQEIGSRMSRSRPSPTPTEGLVLASSRPSVTTPVVPPTGTDSGKLRVSRMPSNPQENPETPLDAATHDLDAATHDPLRLDTPAQAHHAAAFKRPLPEATITECNTTPLNTTLAATPPESIKCIEFHNTSSDVTEVSDSTSETPAGKRLDDDNTTTKCKTMPTESCAKLSCRPTSL